MGAQIMFLMHNTLGFVPVEKQAKLHEQLSLLLGTTVSVRKLDNAISLLRAATLGEPQPDPSAGQYSF